jgi:hypothetical protein
MQMAPWTFGYKLHRLLKKRPQAIGYPFKGAQIFYSMHGCIGQTTPH